MEFHTDVGNIWAMAGLIIPHMRNDHEILKPTVTVPSPAAVVAPEKKRKDRGDDDDDNDDDEVVPTTPQSEEARIPIKLECPPAPKRRKPVIISQAYSRRRLFVSPPDLNTVFIPIRRVGGMRICKI
ncbi:cyclin-dependent protein kinase inhibitor SMR6-like [Impatiens glandulifera]|uniref:cyclin-dependent protein kinase inhibitor SMR6-like n=1 Tax=Impatiens glandulifera TaxID=253017 RepID=UPI001FB07CC8|nr:cyclin-dependent protein kinase inhibitor SMR6-like [Impatiens glandulifera]